MRTWFAVENSLVDRNDLSAFEKLCCMVLARYAGRPEFDHLLTTDIIAVKMGVDSLTAVSALRGLVEKGLVDVDSASELFVETSANHIRDMKTSKDGSQSETASWDEDPLEESDGFDNLDRMIQASKGEVRQRALEDETLEGQMDTVQQGAHDREKMNGSAGRPVETAEGEPVEERLESIRLDQNIHEQSESVRAWIEESESSTRPGTIERQETGIRDREALVSQVLNLIEEPINDRQARIILGLAGYDMDRVRASYQTARLAQVSDKIDMLIHELQKRDAPPAPARRPRSSQVDHLRLHQMKKYQAMKDK